MRTLFKNKKAAVLIVTVVVIVTVGVIWKINSSKQSKPQEESKEDIFPQTQLIPTVDGSVVVAATSRTGKEVLLTVSNIPRNTSAIEYELSYLARGGLPKGVIGTIDVADEDEIERKITLGTCSSGSCVYDQGVEKVKVTLKFNGDYGSKLFEKEFEI